MLNIRSIVSFLIVLLLVNNKTVGQSDPDTLINETTWHTEIQKKELEEQKIIKTSILNNLSLVSDYVYLTHLKNKDIIVITTDTFINNTPIVKPLEQKRSQDIVFENVIFPFEVQVIGEPFNVNIVFKNCKFIKDITLAATFTKDIKFDANFFLGSLNIGGANVNASVNKSLIIENNFFHQKISFCTSKLHDISLLNNYIIGNLDMSDCDMKGEFNIDKNYIGGRLGMLACQLTKTINVVNVLFDGGFILRDSKLISLIINLSQITNKGYKCQINDCFFSNGLVIKNSIIDSLSAMYVGFNPDSSYVDLSNSRIGKVLLGPGSRPYLLDLSNLIINESGFIDIGKLGEELHFSRFGDNKYSKNPSILYLDGTNLDKVQFLYKDYIVGSINYDPSLREFRESASIHFAIDRNDLAAFNAIRNSPIEGILTYKSAQYPPFSDSTWSEKNTTGINYKNIIYHALLDKYQKNGDSESFKNVELEYKRFNAFELNASIFEYIKYYLQKLWWNFGYNKNYIIFWTLFLYILFTLINLQILPHLAKNVYLIDKIDTRITPPQTGVQSPVTTNSNTIRIFRNISISGKPARLINKMKTLISCFINRWPTYRSHLLPSFIYTGFIFFGVKMDADKFLHQNDNGTIWIIIIYTTGLVCTGFLINFIIS